MSNSSSVFGGTPANIMNKVYVIEVENSNLDIVKNDKEIPNLYQILNQNSQRNIDILEIMNIIIDKYKDLKICIIYHEKNHVNILYRKLKENNKSIEIYTYYNVFPTSQIVLVNSLFIKDTYNNFDYNFDILIDMIGKTPSQVETNFNIINKSTSLNNKIYFQFCVTGHSILNNKHQKIIDTLSRLCNRNLYYKLYTTKTKYIK